MSFASQVKAAFEPIYCRLPRRILAGKVYVQFKKLLEDSQYWDETRHREFQGKALRAMLETCARNVPYYRDLFREIGFDPRCVRDVSDMAAVPFLDKETVRAQSDRLLAEHVSPRMRLYLTTGGTMGTPLGFYCLIESGWREKAFMDAQWARVGFKPEHTRAVLKGAVITNDRHWKYDARERAYLLSSFHLTPENAAEYARLIRSRSIRYLHTYPSAALDFARNLQTAGVEIPQFRVVFAGSENMYSGQREAIEKLYGCRVYTWYGHSENVVMAGECEVSTSYHVFPEYGAVEVIKEDGTCATQEGEVGELVGTSLFNTAMPLVRYRTGDWAVLGPKRCSCGRSYRLLSETRGRWFQEMFVGKEGNFISITAVNMHSDLFDHVQQYQFHQKEPGRAVLRIVRGPEYSERDSQNILKQLLAKVGDSMELRLEFWDEIPRTAQGKFRFIVQELPTPISLERDEV